MAAGFFEHPILNSPYLEPSRHHPLDPRGQPLNAPPLDGRRKSELTSPVPAARKQSRRGMTSSQWRHRRAGRASGWTSTLEGDCSINGFVASADSPTAGVQEPPGCQRLDIDADMAVAAPKRSGELLDAGHLMASDIADQFDPLRCQNRQQRVPVLERQMPFAEILTAFGSMPSIDEVASSLIREIAADGDFQIAHHSPPEGRLSRGVISRLATDPLYNRNIRPSGVGSLEHPERWSKPWGFCASGPKHSEQNAARPNTRLCLW